MIRPHMGHHQATLIIGETTALYALSSVPLGASLFLLLIFCRIFPSCLFDGYFSLFYVVYFSCIGFSVVFPSAHMWPKYVATRNVCI
jgi:hypothetical protein